MSEAVFHFPPKAQAELREYREKITRLFKCKLISMAQAEALHFKFMVNLVRQSRTELDNPEGNMLVQCQGCARLHRIPRGIKFYRCECSKTIERPTFVGRVD